MNQALVDRYQAQIAGVLSCYDRVVVTGTLPHICYPEGMTRYLHGCEVPIFEFPAFAQTLRDRLRERAEKLAAEAGIAVEYIGHRGVRKEEVVARVLRERGDHPGLVHVLSAIEGCTYYSRGATSRPVWFRCGGARANACTSISISSTRCSAWCMCGCRPGRRSACSSASMATTGWRANRWPRGSATPCWTTPSAGSTTGAARSNWPTA